MTVLVVNECIWLPMYIVAYEWTWLPMNAHGCYASGCCAFNWLYEFLWLLCTCLVAIHVADCYTHIRFLCMSLIVIQYLLAMYVSCCYAISGCYACL